MIFTTISRNPFARTQLVRKLAPRGRSCAWCDRPAKFMYGTAHDSGAIVWDTHFFCSVGCHRDYSQ